MSERASIDFSGFSCPTSDGSAERIVLGHGGGGLLSGELIERIFLPAFGNPVLERLGDSAVLGELPGRLACSTDSFVVRPLFFPGGSIGELAVNGTVNDLAMSGAVPRFLTAGFILEEGLPIVDLERITAAMAAAAAAAGVRVVAGDTKVVERGHGDGVYINTTGIGVVPEGVDLDAGRIEPGDAVVLSGTLADHGMAVMSLREGLGFEAEIASDTASLHGLVVEMLAAADGIRLLRDPTRGGVATSLNEIASLASAARRAAGREPVGIEIDDAAVPVAPAVASACELLGLDPLLVANEGKLLAIVAGDEAGRLLEAMRSRPEGRNAAVIGRVTRRPAGKVTARTPIGGSRVVPLPVGEQLPRIC